jgi:hypothetical protein
MCRLKLVRWKQISYLLERLLKGMVAIQGNMICAKKEVVKIDVRQRSTVNLRTACQ